MTEYMTRKERKQFFRSADANKEKALRTRPLRVKVYARVSTEHESQINALQNQLEWYKSQIYDNWEFDPDVDMYVDEGITGTSAKKRDAFMQMISDAKQEDCDFDIIITREVSRFARNVEETFRYTRELLEQGIGVLFISDNIWSFDKSADGIVKLSIMSSLAQSESKKVSERALAGQKVSRELGQPYGNGNILGYDKVHHEKNKTINPKTGEVYRTTFTYKINEVQADTVRRIYQLCLEGLGSKRIKTILLQEGHKTATGTTRWQESTINRILNNPTYMGYNAYGKSRVVDYLSHEVEYEHNIDNLELVKGDWEPIISEDEWYRARAERSKRQVSIVRSDNSKSKYGMICSENMWIRKVQCQCGAGLRRNIWRKNKLSDEKVFGYSCYNQVNNGSRAYREKLGVSTEGACGVQNVQECKLELMAKKIFEVILKDRKEAMELALKMITECHTEEVTDNSKQIAMLKKQIKEKEKGKVSASMLCVNGTITESVLRTMLQEIDEEIQGYKLRISSLESEKKEQLNKEEVLKNIEEFFSTQIDFSVPVLNNDLIDPFVKKIICREDSEFVWVLNFNKMNNQEVIQRINHLSEEYKKMLVVDTNFSIFLEFEIPFEECSAYMKSRGRRIVKRGWDTIKVKVALDNN